MSNTDIRLLTINADDAPEWAHRMLRVRTVATILEQSPSTIYRHVNAGRLPSLVRFGGTSRMPGWDLYRRIVATKRAALDVLAETVEGW